MPALTTPLTTPLSNQSQPQLTPLDEEDRWLETTPPKERWELQQLRPKHIDMCALVAQGLANKTIAALLRWSPEYISVLLRQPLIKERIRLFAEAADARLLALTEASVEVIAEVLREGSHKEKLNAARLQMEATNRVGAGRSGLVINQKFVVHVPVKAASAGAWIEALNDVTPKEPLPAPAQLEFRQ